MRGGGAFGGGSKFEPPLEDDEQVKQDLEGEGVGNGGRVSYGVKNFTREFVSSISSTVCKTLRLSVFNKELFVFD